MTGEVFVYLDDESGVSELVGTAYFTQRRGGPVSTTFRYERSWLAKPGAFAIEPELPLSAGQLAIQGRLPAGSVRPHSPRRSALQEDRVRGVRTS